MEKYLLKINNDLKRKNIENEFYYIKEGVHSLIIDVSTVKEYSEFSKSQNKHITYVLFNLLNTDYNKVRFTYFLYKLFINKLNEYFKGVENIPKLVELNMSVYKDSGKINYELEIKDFNGGTDGSRDNKR